jgi:hypothetical protein
VQVSVLDSMWVHCGASVKQLASPPAVAAFSLVGIGLAHMRGAWYRKLICQNSNTFSSQTAYSS